MSRDVISGFTAQVDPRALGLNLQVLVSVTVRSGARQKISEFAQRLREAPGVAQLFFLGGVEDFIIHLMARDSDHVREFWPAQYLSDIWVSIRLHQHRVQPRPKPVRTHPDIGS